MDTGGLTAPELVKMTLEGAKETFEKMAQEAKDAEAKNREQIDLINELKQQIQSLEYEKARQRVGGERAGGDERDVSPTKQSLKQPSPEPRAMERGSTEAARRFEYQNIDADYEGIPAKVDTNLEAARAELREQKQKDAEDARKK